MPCRARWAGSRLERSGALMRPLTLLRQAGRSIAKLTIAAAAAIPLASQSGVFTDALTKCLISATSERDKADMVRWTYGVLSVHPSLAGLPRPSAPHRDEFDRRMGRLVERLLTDQCPTETTEALRYEGGQSLRQAFQALGQFSTHSLLDDPAVRSTATDFIRFMNRDKFDQMDRP